jgi:hypothetical protein
MEIVLDVWEGSLDIDEMLLRTSGVAGLLIRLNDINGGHHLDANYISQWEQSKNFLRGSYFVYNPWVSGDTNFQWLIDHAAADCNLVSADIEVSKIGYSAEIYADEVQRFIDLTSAHFHVVTYTGEWFLSVISHWNNGEYWWARYPWAFYPAQKENWTWEQLKIKVNSCGWNPDPMHRCSGTVKLWQLSGDRLILPGCANRPMDVSIWNGDLQSLEKWWGTPLPPLPGLTLVQRVDILWREAALHGWNLV